MTRVILDPALALPVQSDSLKATGRSWVALLEWCGDPRSTLGANAYQAVSTFYSVTFCSDPEGWCPPSLRPELHEAFLRLLTRSPLVVQAGFVPLELSPPYMGDASHEVLISVDIQHSEVRSSECFAPADGSWTLGTTRVSTTVRKPNQLVLLWDPSEPGPDEARQRRHQHFSSYALIIYGGQPDPSTLRMLVEEFGLSGAQVEWHSSEKHQRPRSPGKRLRGCDAQKTLVVLITGKIGHSTSDQVKSAAGAAGLELVQVETVAGVFDALARTANE